MRFEDLPFLAGTAGLPRGERLVGGVEHLLFIDPAGDDEDRAVRADRAAVMLAKVVGVRAAHHLEIADRPGAEWMALWVDVRTL